MCFLLSKLEIEFVYNISYICAKIKSHWIKEHNNLEYGVIWNCITRSQFKQKKTDCFYCFLFLFFRKDIKLIKFANKCELKQKRTELHLLVYNTLL